MSKNTEKDLNNIIEDKKNDKEMISLAEKELKDAIENKEKYKSNCLFTAEEANKYFEKAWQNIFDDKYNLDLYKQKINLANLYNFVSLAKCLLFIIRK